MGEFVWAVSRLHDLCLVPTTNDRTCVDALHLADWGRLRNTTATTSQSPPDKDKDAARHPGGAHEATNAFPPHSYMTLCWGSHVDATKLSGCKELGPGARDEDAMRLALKAWPLQTD